MLIPQLFNGNTITFAKRDDNGGIMINATEMAKSFDKRPVDWLRLPTTIDFIKGLTEVRKSHFDNYQAVMTIKGGSDLSKQGTWFHEDVALEFARWLSPKFAIWCNDRIKELLTKGSTSIKPQFDIPQTYADALLLATNQAKKLEEQQHLIEQQQPKVLFADAVSTSDSSILIAELAKILTQNGFQIGQNRLFRLLREQGYLCKHGEYYNQPTQKAQELGLFEIKRTSIQKPTGEVLVKSTVKVTGKGQVYFINHFLQAC